MSETIFDVLILPLVMLAQKAYMIITAWFAYLG